jgi:hypothetical protein
MSVNFSGRRVIMRGMWRRDFLKFGLGAAGLTALSATTLPAQEDKWLRMVRPPEGGFCYAEAAYLVDLKRKSRGNYPRIERIEFRRNDRLIETLTQPPYAFYWVPPLTDIGPGTFTATAFQAGTGRVVWSKTVEMYVAQLPPR